MHSEVRAAARVAAVVVGMAVGAGCAMDDAGVGPEPASSAVISALETGPCPPAGCGTNSPVIATLVGFHDLFLVGTTTSGIATTPNEVGLGIVAAGEGRRAQIVKGARTYDLGVVDGKMSGACGPLCPALRGTALRGATITLVYKTQPSFVITVEDVRTMSFFRGGGQTEAYTLTWKSLAGGPKTNVCDSVPLLQEQIERERVDGDDTYATQELMGMQPWETVLFEGDVIDEHTKTMQKAADDTRFNIACAGNLLAKLRLTRNTVHGQSPSLLDPWERRQATMKMLAADYCGGGTPITVGGQWLVWRGDLMVDFYRAPGLIEARWNERGAKCLYAPRMLFPTSDLGRTTFPDPKAAIAAACTAAGRPFPPRCTNLDPSDFDGALRVSANPL